MQNNSKILKPIFLNILFHCLIFVALVTLPNCKSTSADSTADQLSRKKKDTSAQLISKYDAELFMGNSKSTLNKTTILDTLIMGISKQGLDNYIKAEVITSCDGKYFAKLKCSDELIQKFNSTKSNRAYLTARVSRIENINLFANADSLDGKYDELALGSSFLLLGDCIDISEIPESID